MYKEIINLLICPICKKSLKLLNAEEKNGELISGIVQCQSGTNWDIIEGVLDFKTEEQSDANRWTDLTKERTFEELDEMIREKTPKNQMELSNKATEDIINFINTNKPKTVVDIATGRGMLLLDIVKKIKVNLQLICIDLSFTILAADRLKIKQYNPEINVNFIACDATNLPINNDQIDLVVSFFGIANMRNLIEQGIRETFRILKQKGVFLNCSLLVKSDSESFKLTKKYYKELGAEKASNFLLESKIRDFFIRSGYTIKNIYLFLIGESVAKKNELDMIPVEGDWFAIAILNCKKII
jgi:ubiquinone/menaquinone biosynthesis C-methylase UbiE/uncharacterized protein YbaR (Trm112 family)